MSASVAIGKMDAVFIQHLADALGHVFNELAQELGGSQFGRLGVQLGKGKLGGPVDGYGQIKLSLRGLHLGDVHVEVAYRVAFKLLLGRLWGSLPG